MADPGFPRGGGANPKGGAPIYYLANFSRKLHENEEILSRGRARPSRPPLDPPLSASSLLTFFIGLIPSKHSEQQPGTSLYSWLHFCASIMNVNITFIFISFSSSSLSSLSSLLYHPFYYFRLLSNFCGHQNEEIGSGKTWHILVSREIKTVMTEVRQESSGHQNKKKQGMGEWFWPVL